MYGTIFGSKRRQRFQLLSLPRRLQGAVGSTLYWTAGDATASAIRLSPAAIQHLLADT
jgi:hypothetical protein